MIIDFADFLYQLIQTHGLEVLIGSAVDHMIRIALHQHAIEAEHDVISIKITGRLKPISGLKFHALAQMKSVGLSAIAHLP